MERYKLWRVGAINYSEEGGERRGRKKGAKEGGERKGRRKEAKGEEEYNHEIWC